MEFELLFVLQLIILIFAQFLCLLMSKVLLLFFLISGMCFGQDQTILLTINDEQITTEEFLNSYKRNREIIATSQKTSLVEYLQLFIDYKLKVQEAITQGYATNGDYKKELKTYRDQLAQKFIKNTKVTDTLVNEAYYRIINEVNARHILVKIKDLTDTLSSYNRILKARQRIINGEDFGQVAREISDDPSVKNNAGDLGWFGAFKMVYPFENNAYHTKIADVSMPFRTEFGYHIVQPTATRKSLGLIEVAHIMIAHKQPDSSIAAEQKIKQVQQMLENGEDFTLLARTYSDDKSSSLKGGKLQKFSQGQLRSKVFEKQAFLLKTKNEYSKPFETDYGWHIVMLLNREPIKPLVELREALTQKVTRDTRSKVIDQTLYDKLRQKYGVHENEELISFFDEFFNSETQYLSEDQSNKIALTVRETTYNYKELFDYLSIKVRRIKNPNNIQQSFIRSEINRWIDTTLKSYYLQNLEKENVAFFMLLKEYKEGLLVFDFLQDNVWEAAINDATGLESYFQKNLAQYDSNNIDDVKGKVMNDYQKELEAIMVKKLRKNATITVENKILLQISSSYDNK